RANWTPSSGYRGAGPMSSYWTPTPAWGRPLWPGSPASSSGPRWTSTSSIGRVWRGAGGPGFRASFSEGAAAGGGAAVVVPFEWGGLAGYDLFGPTVEMPPGA